MRDGGAGRLLAQVLSADHSCRETVSRIIAQPLSELLNRSIPAAERATVLSLESVVLTALLAVVEPIVFAVATATTLALALGLSSVLVLGAAGVLLALWWSAQPEMALASPR